MIVIDASAPSWAQDLARKITDEIQQSLAQPVKLPVCTVLTLPSAARFNGCAIIVSNETGGRTIATSDATNWRRVRDGAVVS